MLESSAGILQGFVEVALSPIKAAAKVRAKAHAARCHATMAAWLAGHPFAGDSQFFIN